MEDQEVATSYLLDFDTLHHTQKFWDTSFFNARCEKNGALHTTGGAHSLTWSHWPADVNKTEIIVVQQVAVLTLCIAVQHCQLTCLLLATVVQLGKYW